MANTDYCPDRLSLYPADEWRRFGRPGAIFNIERWPSSSSRQASPVFYDFGTPLRNITHIRGDSPLLM